MLVSSTGGPVQFNVGGTMPPDIKWHAWLMWFCWSIVAMLEIVSNRYLKHLYYAHQWIHSIVGYLSVIASSIGVYEAWKFTGHKIVKQLHPLCGVITYILFLLVVALGMIAMLMRKFVRKDWETDKLIVWARIHKTVAWVLIFLS